MDEANTNNVNTSNEDAQPAAPTEPQTETADAEPQEEQVPDEASTAPETTTDEHDVEQSPEQTIIDEHEHEHEHEQKTTIKHAFSAAARTRTSLTSNDLSLVGSVQVKLTLNVGSKSMTIADVLNLERGSVITLNRREHDPLDVLINGVLFARGEVVRTGDYYGLRILEII